MPTRHMRIPFIGRGCLGRSEVVNSERLINMYPQRDPTGRATVALYNTPGLILRDTIGDGPIRGMLEYDDVLYVVSGDTLYSITGNFVEVEEGTLSTSEGIVTMATNGLVVLIVDGSSGYTFTIASSTFATIVDADFPGDPESAVVADGHFLVMDRGTQRIHFSTTGTAWATNDWFSAEATPDDMTAIIADHNEAILFGKRSTEVWRFTADGWFPIDGMLINVGCAAAGSPALLDNSVVWLDDNFIVRRLNGPTPVRLSDHDVEYIIRNHTNPEITAARAFSYTQEGHSFYQLTVGEDTVVYDASNNKWHTRAYREPDTAVLTRHRADCHALFRKQNIVGDYENGNLYQYDLDTYTDNDDEIPAYMVYRHLDAEGRKVFYDLIEMELESGIGTQEGQGEDPQIEVRYSDDGGREWSIWRQADIGRIGLYRTRARWRRLGHSHDRVFEFRISDPVKRVINNANLEVTLAGS